MNPYFYSLNYIINILQKYKIINITDTNYYKKLNSYIKIIKVLFFLKHNNIILNKPSIYYYIYI